MRIRVVIALAAPVLVASTALAQISSYTLEMSENTVTVHFRDPGNIPVAAITGAPYSADQVSETVQTLVDGTHVTQGRNVQHVVRDSQGRTRTERPLLFTRDANARNPTVTDIRDPIEGLYYILDQQNKVAHRFALPSAPTRPKVTRQAANAQAQAGTASPRASTASVRPETSVEKLGSQVLDGVLVEGSRWTATWPVGSQGNDRPIVTTHESWYSQELKTTLFTRSSDPLHGESTFKLTNVDRTEPDPALFQAPPDFTIVDEKGPFTMTVSRQ